MRKKFILHFVPFAVPLFTLKSPSGMRTFETQVCAGLSSVVSAVNPSTTGSVIKKWSNGAPVARTLDLRARLESVHFSKGGSTSRCNERVVDESLVRDVVGRDFELKVRLWINGAMVDECFHDLILVDVVIVLKGSIEVVICLIVSNKVDPDVSRGVAEIDFSQWERSLVWD